MAFWRWRYSMIVDLNVKLNSLVVKLLPEAVIAGRVSGKDRDAVEPAVVSIVRKVSTNIASR